MNRWPFIRSLSIVGLKGACGDYALDRCTAITGPNGAGKSRIGEALAFLLGRQIAGMETSANNLRDLLDGDDLRVVATVATGNGDVVVTRMRQLVGSTFKRPTLLIDGRIAPEDALIDVFGGSPDASGGADLIGMSEARLVAAIAGFAAASDAVDALATRVAALGVRVPDGDPSPTARLDAIATATSAAVKAASRERRAVEAGADLSRSELGDRFDVNELGIARAKAAAAVARLADLQHQLGMLQGRVSELDRRLSALRAEAKAIKGKVVAAGDVNAPTRADVEAAEADRERLDGEAAVASSEQMLAWNRSMQAQSAREETAAAWNTAAQQLERAESRLASLAGHASVIESAPCARCDLWQPPDPFEDEEALSSTCPLLSNARAAAAALPAASLDVAAKSAEVKTLKAAAHAADDVADEARTALDSAEAALAEARRRRSQASDRLMDLHRRAAAAPVASQRARVEEIAGAVAQLDAARDAAMVEVGARREAVSEASRDVAEATAVSDAAAGRAERFRRLQADRERLAQAEAIEASLKAVAEEVEATQRGFLSVGLDMLARASSRYLPGLTVDVVGGRLGVKDASGTFWSGAGLSAAQRAMLELALDRAVETLAGRVYPIVVIEADTIDDSNLRELVKAVDADIKSGAVAQALLIAWREIHPTNWAQIRVGPSRNDTLGAAEDDPWADPWADDKPTIPDLIAGLDGFQMTRLWKDEGLPELSRLPMPRRIAERKEAAIGVFAGLGYDIAAAAIERARNG